METTTRRPESPFDESGVLLAERLAEFTVEDDADDDARLIDPHGIPADTWRDGYPYHGRLSRGEYEQSKRLLQIELLKLQYWIKSRSERLVILFEGRDAAGKGGTIKPSG